MGALSDAQCQQIRQFVNDGGGLVATSESRLFDEDGFRRPDFALSDLLGAHATGESAGSTAPFCQNTDIHSQYSYVRIHPAVRGQLFGPLTGSEPQVTGDRHPTLAKFAETDILPFGGRIELVHVDETTSTPLTYIPEFSSHPPELSWIREPDDPHPAMVLNESFGGGRVAYLPVSMDFCYALYNLPDQGELIAQVIRWSANIAIPVEVAGPGMIDCHLHRQRDRIILHLVNLTSAGTWRSLVEELIPVGPLQVTVTIPDGVHGISLRTLVSDQNASFSKDGSVVRFEIASIADHEICVIEQTL